MTLDDLRLLLDFHYWARDRLLEAAERLSQEDYTRELVSSFPSVRATMTHVYGAEWVWYSRWQGRSPNALPAFDALADVAALRTAWVDLEHQVRAFLEQVGEPGLTREYDYTLFSGQHGRSGLWQMLQHVVNHATYHRGQVTTMLRQLGARPPRPTDLIAFYRERASGA